MQAHTGLSATVPTGPNDISMTSTESMSNVSHPTPSNSRRGLPSLDSTIWGGIAHTDSTRLHLLPSCSAELSISSSDLPDLDSQASSLDDEGDDRTILTVATDMDASSIFDMLC